MKIKLVKRGDRAIELRITINKTREYISTGIKVAPSNWNAKTQFVKRGHPNQDAANETFTALVNLAWSRYNSLLEKGIPTAKEIREAMKRKPTGSGPMLADWIRARLPQSTNTDKTKQKVGTTLNYLDRWPGHCSISGFDAKALDGLQNWLLEQSSYRGGAEKTLSRASVKSYLYSIKSFVSDAARFGMISRDPFLGWTMKNTASKHYEFLTAYEVNLFKKVPLDLTKPHEREVKDAFLFICCTGPRIGDLESMPLSAIRPEQDGLHFKYMPSKTSRHANPVTVDLHLDNLFGGLPMRIVAPRLREGKPLLFDLGARSQSLVVLKRLCKRAGIRAATWHWGRETCGTQLLNNGYTLEMVKAVLGHKSIATTERYARMLKETLNEKARQVWRG